MKNVTALLIVTILLAACSPAVPPPVATTAVQPATTTPAPTLTNSPTATTIPTATPTPYPPVKPQLAAGDYHTCLLSPRGTVKCWGWNDFGQSGSSGDVEQVLPGEELALQGIVQISASAFHTCAVDAVNRVFCWGRNNNGQLGDGTTVDSSLPVQVTALSGTRIAGVTAGTFHTCAWEQDGRAWCWGSNRDGKLGSGSDDFNTLLPGQVPTPVNQVVAMAAGADFTCAAGRSGEIWCWGNGQFGQTGNKLMTGSRLPETSINLIPDVTALVAGWFHTCAITKGGEIACWGKDYEGALGNSGTASRALAALVTGISNKKEVSLLVAGGRSGCAVTTQNELYCWGKNDYGQIGNGSVNDALLPSLITGVQGKIISIAVGASHTCALTEENNLWCWGANDHWQLGMESAEPALVPVMTGPAN